MSISEEERKNAPAHAGSGESFPLGPGCKHVESAWNLRGHGNKAAHERRIRAYAKKHGCSLPQTAQKGAADEPVGEVVSKGFNPVGKTWVVQKAWVTDSGETAIEGWVSTTDEDLDKDIVEPEAFYGDPFEDYFSRSAPLSSNHNTNNWPVGHLQKGALVRDGVIIQEEYHPTDPAEFAYFDPTAKKSGWYARGIITDAKASEHVAKGNVGGFSWIGNLKEYEPLPSGGKRYHMVSPLIETTVAAYPVNPMAVMRIAKAYGLTEDTMTENTTQNAPALSLEEIMIEAGKRAEEAAQKTLTAKGALGTTEIGDLLLQFEKRMDAKLEPVMKALADKPAALPDGVTETEDEPVQKAQTGAGRKGTLATKSDPRMDNPVAYIVAKSRKGEALDVQDKDFMWALTAKALGRGMSQEPIDGDDFADADA